MLNITQLDFIAKTVVLETGGEIFLVLYAMLRRSSLENSADCWLLRIGRRDFPFFVRGSYLGTQTLAHSKYIRNTEYLDAYLKRFLKHIENQLFATALIFEIDIWLT